MAVQLNPFVLFAVFFSSMLGAQLLGISLNKIALLPLECFLFIKVASGSTKIRFGAEKRNLCVWYFILLFSSSFNLLNQSQLDESYGKLVFNLAQYIVIYIPILLMIDAIERPFDQLKASVGVVAKVNCAWAIVQFLCWYILSFDFNSFVFVNLLKGVMGTKWTAWNYETGTLAIRATGLNYDPAFLALILVLGYIFTKSKIWKCFYLLGCVAAMSRVGMVTIFLMELFAFCKENISAKGIDISAKSVVKITVSIFAAGALFLILYSTVEIVQFQTDYLIARFSFIGTASAADQTGGTNRHIMYIPAAIVTWLDSSLFNILFGIGPRIGGNALALGDAYGSMLTLNTSMFFTSWAIECDFAELLLGCGILGFAAYYFILWDLAFRQKMERSYWVSIASILLFGFMYCVSLNTLINLCLIFMAADKGRMELSKNKKDFSLC